MMMIQMKCAVLFVFLSMLALSIQEPAKASRSAVNDTLSSPLIRNTRKVRRRNKDSRRQSFRGNCFRSWISHVKEGCQLGVTSHHKWTYDYVAGACVQKSFDQCLHVKSTYQNQEDCDSSCGTFCDLDFDESQCRTKATAGPPSNKVVFDKADGSCTVKDMPYSVFRSVKACQLACGSRHYILSSVKRRQRQCPAKCARSSAGACNSDFTVSGRVVELTQASVTVELLAVLRTDDPRALRFDLKPRSRITLLRDPSCSCISHRIVAEPSGGAAGGKAYFVSGIFRDGIPTVVGDLIESTQQTRRFSVTFLRDFNRFCRGFQNWGAINTETVKKMSSSIAMGTSEEFTRLAETRMGLRGNSTLSRSIHI